MQNTPRSIRPHIAIFGRRNVGKSSLINALTDQQIALVSATAGTTADPVYKNMELLPFGPVVLIDTAGLDDVGELGKMRVEASRQVMNKTDLALVVLEPRAELTGNERELIDQLKKNKTSFIVVINKCEKVYAPESLKETLDGMGADYVEVSAVAKKNIDFLKVEKIQKALQGFDKGTIIADLVNAGDVVVLVVPIDPGAPRGRLILPQVQTIRELLDSDAIAIVAKEKELVKAIDNLKNPPALVVTDSQAFEKVAADLPSGIPFTGFSVLFARYKGDLNAYIGGIKALEKANGSLKILIAESCTHHQMEDDIGRIKIPKWLRQKYGNNLEFEFSQGINFPDNLADFGLVIQCGGCMTNRKEILSRIEACKKAGVPITNYGILIAHLHGVLENAIKPFGLILEKD
jgi:[FeFe] hydrogenase H-cluster maturation GTPase HydF